MLHSNPLFRIYFGNKQDSLHPTDYTNVSSLAELAGGDMLRLSKKRLGTEQTVFLNQVHGAHGYLISQDNLDEMVQPFVHAGDYLITRMRGVALGVMTADCLPIILYDRRVHALAVIHAGWRGSVAGVAVAAYRHMQREYGSNEQDIRIFFGPSIKPCCYQVGVEVVSHAERDPLLFDALQHYADAVYLDLSRYNKLQFLALGFDEKAFHLEYNTCTACDERLCSYRRDGAAASRQITLAVLR